MTERDAPPDVEPAARPRHHRRWPVVAIVMAVVLVLVGAWFVFVRAVEPDEPSAFYDPPDPVPAGAPGAIVRSEAIDATSTAFTLERVLYTSTDSSGEPIAVSGVVAVPTSPPPADGWPVIAWAHGTSGIASRCALSLEVDGGVARIPELDRLISAGNVVVATDYAGLGTPGPHPYLIGESEGRAVLDSIRAARSLLGPRASATNAVFGHSQGGHATMFAAQLAPTYASELDVVGVAAMAPPANLGELLERDAREPAGIVLTALAISSWSRLYPEADEAAVVHAEARPAVAALAEGCVLSTGQSLASVPEVLALTVRFLSADPVDTPGWSTLLQANSLGATTIAVPVLVAQGQADELVRPDVTAAFVAQQCAAGAIIELHTYAGVGHLAVRTAAAADVGDWLLDRLAGQPVATACTNVAS